MPFLQGINSTLQEFPYRHSPMVRVWVSHLAWFHGVPMLSIYLLQLQAYHTASFNRRLMGTSRGCILCHSSRYHNQIGWIMKFALTTLVLCLGNNIKKALGFFLQKSTKWLFQIILTDFMSSVIHWIGSSLNGWFIIERIIHPLNNPLQWLLLKTRVWGYSSVYILRMEAPHFRINCNEQHKGTLLFACSCCF